MKVVAARSKAKAKPQKRETVELQSTIPMNERKWIDIEPAESSLCVRGLEESRQYSSTLSNSKEYYLPYKKILCKMAKTKTTITTGAMRPSVRPTTASSQSGTT